MRCTGFPYERTWYELDTKAHDRNFLLLLFSVNTQDSVSYSYIDPTFLNLKIKKKKMVDLVMCALELRLLRWFIWLLRFIWSLLWPSVELLSLCGLKPFTWVQTLLWKFLSFSSNGPCPKYKVASAVPAKPERGCQNNSSELKHLHREILFPPPINMSWSAIVLPELLTSERKEKWKIQMV